MSESLCLSLILGSAFLPLALWFWFAFNDLYTTIEDYCLWHDFIGTEDVYLGHK